MNDKASLPSISDIRKVLTLDRRTLPSFPQAALKLLRMSEDETTSVEDISKVVESDPGIAARVLEVRNLPSWSMIPMILISLGAIYLKKIILLLINGNYKNMPK